MQAKAAGRLHLFYIDDSGDESISCYTALGMPDTAWADNFKAVKAFRSKLKVSDGILLRSEFHATQFVAGRGNLGADIVTKWRRCQIFNEALLVATKLKDVRLINVACPRTNERFVFEKLLNRIQKNMERVDGLALLFCDEGKEAHYTKLARRMKVFNPIPSRLGAWENGNTHKNITLDRIIEDLIFRNSKSSYMIQLVDFCAYALLRKERPIPSKTRYGLDRSFFILDPILVKQASYSDPHGIVR